MDDKPAAHSPTDFAAPPRLSAEYTPIQYDYYIKKAQQMRADSMAGILRAIGSALRSLFARTKPAPRRQEPILVKSRTA